MKKQKFSIPVKPLAGIALICLVLFFAVSFLWQAAKNSPLFYIKDVVVRCDGATDIKADLSYLKGKNIFEVGLEREELAAARIYPGFSQIKLMRVLPDRIFAYFIKRKPLALVKLYRGFYVDGQAVLFDISELNNATLELPVITGLETKIFSPKAGRKYNCRELNFALNIIKAVKSSRQLRGLKIKRIDAANLENAYFTAGLPVIAQNMPQEGIEIKISPDNIAEKINILASLLIQERRDWANIKYIDLRFKEPVIKFSDKKDKPKK